MKQISILLSLLTLSLFSSGQTLVRTQDLNGDLIRIWNRNGTAAELKIENATKGITNGFLKNIGGGTTAFALLTVADLSNFPSQTSNSGKYLTTNGTTLSWGTIDLSTYLTITTAASTYVPLTRTLNSLALSANQTFATGTTGTDFAISSSGTTHTFNIPDASASARGLITTGTQTIAGTKTINGDLYLGSGSSRTFGVASPSSTGAGNNLTIQAGIATTSGAGGTLTLAAGTGAGGGANANLLLRSETVWIGRSYSGNINGTYQLEVNASIPTLFYSTSNTYLLLKPGGSFGETFLASQGYNVATYANPQVGGVAGNAGTYSGTSVGLWANSTVAIAFGHGTSERMRLATTTGNLLVGTATDAGYKLDVNGTTRLQGALTTTSTILSGGSITVPSGSNFVVSGSANGVVTPQWSLWGGGASVINISSASFGQLSRLNFGQNGITTTPAFAINNGEIIVRDANNGVASSFGVGVSGTMNASAKFQVDATDKGFLIPRMTGAQAEAISSPIEGLIIYCSNGNGVTITSKGTWQYDGATWNKF